MESPLTHYEHEEFARLLDEKYEHLTDATDRLEKLTDEKVNRLHDEDVRLGKRVSTLEDNFSQLNDLTVSVRELAMSMQSMCKEQEAIRKTQEEESNRLRTLEDKDGEKWKKMWGYIIPPLITLVLGFVFAQIGLA